MEFLEQEVPFGTQTGSSFTNTRFPWENFDLRPTRYSIRYRL
jgi:hypothetical protein